MQILCQSIKAWTVTSLLSLLNEIKSAVLKSTKILSVTKCVIYERFGFSSEFKIFIKSRIKEPLTVITCSFALTIPG